jgi:hypothetical protein
MYLHPAATTSQSESERARARERERERVSNVLEVVFALLEATLSLRQSDLQVLFLAPGRLGFIFTATGPRGW